MIRTSDFNISRSLFIDNLGALCFLAKIFDSHLE